jgi:hypothetical protein
VATCRRQNRFSELVNRALTEGPQLVLRHTGAVVVVERRQYEKLTGKQTSFKEFLTGKGPRAYRESILPVIAPSCATRNCESFARHMRPVRVAPPQA